jgi:hypothetical protein
MGIGRSLYIKASWANAADDRSNIEWARSAWRDMRGFSTGDTYINMVFGFSAMG